MRDFDICGRTVTEAMKVWAVNGNKPKLNWERIKILYVDKGMSACEVAKLEGCTLQMVCYVLHKSGIKTRNKRINYIVSDKTRAIIGAKSKGHKLSQLSRDKIRFANKVINKQLWQDEKYVAKIRASRKMKPNKVESQLISILDNNFPNKWKYVGDLQLIIGGRCPDFANVNGKKQLIELFGTYWHPVFDVAKRVDHYRQFGYRTLIIWEDELKTKSEEQLVNKIREFSYK
jgi:G:T-mismatch repair DNA endonuclease (very short patch repair protein)